MSDAQITHAFVSPLTDAGEEDLLGPDAWNAALVLSGGVLGDVLTRDPDSATGGSWTTPTPPTPSAWGTISGTIGDQADLVAALAAKPNLAGSYTDPVWITSLAGAKVTGTVPAATLAAGATVLATPRAINGIAFNGSADITVPAAAGTLSGATLAANVLTSSLTSVGVLTALTVTATIVGSVSGNAATATAFATPRTINGTAFDGTADITISAGAAAAGTLTGTDLAANVVASSLTSLGVLSGLTVQVDNLGTTSTDGVVLQNTTATDGGHPNQLSPRLRLSAYCFDAWNGVAKTGDIAVEAYGGSHPTTFAAMLTYRVATKIAAGSYITQFTVDSVGVATATTELVAPLVTTPLISGGNNKTRIGLSGTPANGQVQIAKFDQSAGIILDAASGVLKVYDLYGSTQVEIQGASVTLNGSAASKIGVDTSLLAVNSDIAGNTETSTLAGLYLAHSNDSAAFYIDQANNSAGTAGAGISQRRARGTAAAPADVASGDQIGFVDFRAYSGTKFWRAGLIAAHVDGTVTTGQAPSSRLVFATNAGNGNSTERARITKDGCFYVGTTAPLTGLTSAVPFIVKQGAAVAAYTVAFKGSTSGSSYGLRVEAGSGSGDGPLWMYDQSNATLLFKFQGDGKLAIPAIKSLTGTRYLVIDTNGLITSSASAPSGT